MIDKETLKQKLTQDDIIKLVCHLGSDPPKVDNKDNLIFNTICHNRQGEGSYKLYYYDNSKLFQCYTECNKTFDIYELVQKVNNITFTQAIFFVQQFTGYNFYESKSIENKINDWDFIKKYVKKPSINSIKLKEYDSIVLKMFPKKYHHSWIDEGICIEAMKKFNIHFDVFENKIIIPHYDINNRLIGIRCRNLNEDIVAKGMKYMPIKVENEIYSHPLSYNLYGIKENLLSIRKLQKTVIFEGEKSVLKTETFYPNNNFSLAVCGDKISEFQKNMIIKNSSEVIIAFDKGEGYEKGNKNESIIRIRDIAKRFAPYIKTYILVDKKNLLSMKEAPVDQGKDVFEHLLRTKIEVRTFLSY